MCLARVAQFFGAVKAHQAYFFEQALHSVAHILARLPTQRTIKIDELLLHSWILSAKELPDAYKLFYVLIR
jgi:hypothetical protein